MSTGALAALVTAITGLVAAVGGVLAVIRHVNGPQHTEQPPPVTPKS